MPWSEKQNKVWRAIEHGWRPPSGKFSGVSADEAAKMADEGVDHEMGRRMKQARRKHDVSRKVEKG